MASSSTLSFIIQAMRAATNRSQHEFNTVVTISDVKQFSCIDVKLAASQVAVQAQFGTLTNIVGVIVHSPKKVGLHFNGAGSVEIECGSLFVALDTVVTSIHIDNDLLASPEEQTVEVWVVTKT